MVSSNNAQFLLTINKNTALVTSKLKSVVYNGMTVATSGSLLSSFLYKENVIEFTAFSNSNLITLNLGELPIHQKLIVRARVFT
jgi:hypothetical protein